ncbi:MAG: sugar lactone lactonase YvrE [Candidatus Nitrosomirales archaeon]|jgi:sugar lactone lactonase YvrE
MLGKFFVLAAGVFMMGFVLMPLVQAQEEAMFITKWGSYGSGNGEFASSKGITIDSSDNVFVVDQGNNRIQKFDKNGNFITTLGSYCNVESGDGCIDPDGSGSLALGDGQLSSPYGIAIDSRDNLYVADSNNHRIQKFDKNGNFITKWGSYGTGDGEFNYPSAIAIDSSGKVYVGDSLNDRIQKFDKNGNFITKWGSYCYLASGDGCIDPDDQGPLVLGDSQFGDTNDLGVAVDSRDKVYVSDPQNNRIEKFDKNGNFITKWGSYCFIESNYDGCVDPDGSGSLAVGDGQFLDPTGIAFDISGNVYVADADNHRIEKFDKNGNFITKWGSQCNLLEPWIGCIDPDGSGQLVLGDGQFYTIIDLDFNSSDVIYVTDEGNHRIEVFTLQDNDEDDDEDDDNDNDDSDS